jgi:hypothetical protein
MSEILLENLLKASSNPVQSDSILGMMGQAVEFVKKMDSIVSVLQKWGVSPQIIEKLAIKYGDLDKVPELPALVNSNRIIARSNMHASVFEELNKLDEKSLAALIEAQKEKDGNKGNTKPRANKN